MTTQALIEKSTQIYGSLAKDFVSEQIKVIKSVLPRPCMIVSGGLLTAGLGIPALMGFSLIPASLFLGFLGLILFCIGLVSTFYYL